MRIVFAEALVFSGIGMRRILSLIFGNYWNSHGQYFHLFSLS